MAAPGQGFMSYFQFGRESTWGTDVAATKRLPINRADPVADIGRIRPNTMDGTLVLPPLQAGGIRALSTIELPLTYTGMLILWDCVMGTATYGANGGATTGSNPYTHTWTAFGQHLNSLTLEHNMGDIPTSKVEQIVGAKIAKATLKGSAGLAPDEGIITCTLELVGKTLSTNVEETGALTSPTPDYVLFSHMANMADPGAGANAQVLDFELVIDTGLAAERFYMQGAVGNVLKEPLRKQRPTARLSVTAEFINDNTLDAFIANTKSTGVTLNFTGAGSLQFAFSFAQVAISEPVHHPTEGDDFLRERFVIEAEGAVSLQIVNAQATITT